MLFSQNSSSSFVSSLIILGSYQETIFYFVIQIIDRNYFLLVKKRTRGPIAKYIDESCPVLFARCLGVKVFYIKIFLYLLNAY